MKRLWILVAAGMLLPQGAQATVFDVSYIGTIDSILIPEGAQGLAVGDQTFVSFRYDTDDLVDISNAPGLAAYGVTSVPGLALATLANPYNSLTIKVDSVVANAANDYDFGGNHGFGGFPNFPAAVFLNGQLLGVEFEGLYDDVADFGVTPLAHLTLPDLATADLLGYYYPDLSDFENYEISFTGSFDLANARITAVPEPGSWLMIVLGMGALGTVLRRQTRQTAVFG